MTLDFQALSDRIAIEEHILRYAHLVDSGRLAGVAAEIFTEDAVLRFGDMVLEGRDAIDATLTGSANDLAGCSHNVTNLLIQVDGDSARASYRILGWHWYLRPDGRPSQASDMLTVGGYEDELVRRPEGWRVHGRRSFALGSGIGVGAPPPELTSFFDRLAKARISWP